MKTARDVGFAGAGVVLLASLSGCIVVSKRQSDFADIELRRADAQYMAARVELERINLERHKLGLAPVEIPPPRISADLSHDETSPTSYP